MNSLKVIHITFDFFYSALSEVAYKEWKDWKEHIQTYLVDVYI